MNTAPLPLALKVDVDTLQGYLEGVPRLAELCQELGIRATFCVAMGPDRSGRAVRRFFTKRGFLRKMLRTRAVSMYGPRTLLYGTLLPAPLIAARRPQILADLLAAGHEVIPHGWDHVDWHDYLPRWDLEKTREQMRRACDAYEQHTGQPCHAFAAPGWQATAHSVAVEEELGLEYAADTRGWGPFFPSFGDHTGTVLQIPTTLPTLDELIGLPGLKREDLTQHLLDLLSRPPAAPPPDWRHGPAHVFTLHAEAEGRDWLDWFGELLGTLRERGHGFLTLRELARRAKDSGQAPTSPVLQAEIPGRAGTVSCQG